ncbi:uncharacterized protein [Asterias amurensis]|uniref:uncharacterized protein n=1 Tax=Asterias amurensis TaxID=7602 RepID=UPI003AB17B0C
MEPIPNGKPADGSSLETAVPMPTPSPMPAGPMPGLNPSDQPPAYNPEWTAPPNVQYAPVGGVPAAGNQAAYPPPVQGGGYPPPGQGAAYPPTQGSYPPPQGSAYPPTQYQYPAGYNQLGGQTTVTGTTTSHIVLTARTCAKCQSGVMQEQFTACGILCAIFFFPFGVFCCLAMREYRCSHCLATF